eukprot:TRINITY_DN1160_c0_g2_i1.p1 TRINITY_DN1160_c0_g2~~TRINITY_DN1160_c0_g2_i1.p1  ORF type:complete len:479 (+),score=90.83 TRINITY_DN1160_c0_g2_i1:140-1576(+)
MCIRDRYQRRVREQQQANMVVQLQSTNHGPLDELGYSVSVDGDSALIGSFDVTDKAAYIFTRSGSTWSQQGMISASDPAGSGASDGYGKSVSLSGDSGIVGSPNHGTPDAGAAYIYARTGTSWLQQAKLTASPAGSAADGFGQSVAISGTMAIVGAPDSDVAASSSGAVYVFTNSGGTWSQTSTLTASDSAASTRLGWVVSLSGTRAVAQSLKPNSGSSAGSAYVFEQSGASWVEQKLTMTSTPWFGNAAINGDLLVVGAYQAQHNGVTTGGAYVYERASLGSWVQKAGLSASDGVADMRFGSSVAVCGDYTVVGAPADNNFVGAAYVFKKGATSANWTQQTRLTAFDASASAQYGFDVACDGTYGVVGAPYSNTAGSISGASYLYALANPDLGSSSSSDSLSPAILGVIIAVAVIVLGFCAGLAWYCYKSGKPSKPDVEMADDASHDAMGGGTVIQEGNGGGTVIQAPKSKSGSDLV